MLVHGDDYFTSGHTNQLDWLEKSLGEKYEIQTQRIGVGPGRDLEGKILNRIVRWTPNGYELEADPRHAELIVKTLKVESMKPLGTPGVEGKEEDDDEDDKTGRHGGNRL